jgi:prevent-host-death family protein
MKQVNIHQAKTELSKLVERAEAGEEVLIARAGRPVAKLVPLDRARGRRKLGLLDGKFRIPDDFNKPLPPSILGAFEGGSNETAAGYAPAPMGRRPAASGCLARLETSSRTRRTTSISALRASGKYPSRARAAVATFASISLRWRRLFRRWDSPNCR